MRANPHDHSAERTTDILVPPVFRRRCLVTGVPPTAGRWFSICRAAASRPHSLSVLCEAGSRGRRSSPDPATAAHDERSEGNLPMRNEPVLTFIW